MAQEPQGLWHLDGSMQELGSALEQALATAGGALHCNHSLTGLRPIPGGGWSLEGRQGRLGAGGPGGSQGGAPFHLDAREVVVTLPPQALKGLLGDAMPRGYDRRISGFGDPSGALVFYGAAPREALNQDLGLHGQLEWTDPGNLFVSISREGDGRAPAGQATVIASVFTAARPWFGLDPASYQARKVQALAGIQAGLNALLGIRPEQFLHQELATPRGFAHWTGRPFGFVGGLGQQPDRFGPFGLASRTPLPGLWLCGDGIHPGEGTAGVSLCALMVCRQLLAGRGRALRLRGR
jgi:C-3',4' desaturase CrtD